MSHRRFAPAKVNLALHVTGRRADGYHLLDSLVVFAGAGDWISVAADGALTLDVTGPRSEGVPTDDRNLIWKAAQAFDPPLGARIILDKHLPHAGGIGGGSADAAAALHGLAALWDRPLPGLAAQLAIGADIPVCVHGAPCRMRGIGDVIDPVPPLPPLWIVLANAGVAVPTGAVFSRLATAENPPLPDPDWSDLPGFVRWLCIARNDLWPPARDLVSEIGTVLDHLEARPGCLLARMSGSGGTCFGLFGAEDAATDAARALGRDQPDWWVASAPVLGAS